MSHVCVHDYPIPVGVVEYLVCSSDLYSAKLPEEGWESPTRAIVTSTLRGGGAAKGRVLYLLEGKKRIPVAALAYHIESTKELHIRCARGGLALKDYEKDFVRALLASADGIVRKMPGRQGAGWIYWEVPSGEAQAIRDAYGFQTAPGNKSSGATVVLRRQTSET